MRWLIAVATLSIIVILGLMWWGGWDRAIAAWALDGQREAQGAMAGALRRLRGGDATAVGALLAVCFGYGFFHAVGPGHGKLLIGGYGAARAIGAARLSMVALASSIAQGLTAIILVGAGLLLLGLGREQMTDMADRLFAPISFAAIAAIGLWLVFRGARTLWRQRAADLAEADAVPAHDHGLALAHGVARQTAQPHDHGHDHGHTHTHAHGHGHAHDHDHHHDHAHDHDGGICSTCGHAHAPDPVALAKATSTREVVALIAAVAVRPCTGALFVLILTAQLGVFWAGIAGTLAMALGTASVTIAVALASTTLREGVLAGIANSPTLARVQPLIEVSIGALVAIVATNLALLSV